MKTRTALMVAFAMIAAVLVTTLLIYPSLPAQMPSHWDLEGNVDAWGSKASHAFIMIGFMLLMTGFLAVADWISPLQYKIAPFRGTFNQLMLIVIAMMAYIHAVIIAAGLGYRYDPTRWLIGGMFLFLALIGNYLGKVRRNFWVGIRTPWTLASEEVWIATHRLGARLLVAVSLLGAIGIWVGVPPLICFGLLMAGLFIPVFYSLWLSKHLERGQSA